MTSSNSNTPLFTELVEPAFSKVLRLHAQFDRLKSHDIVEHQTLLDEIKKAEQGVWAAIALSTSDINTSLIPLISKESPKSLSRKDKDWISMCLRENKMPLMDEDTTTPIRFLEAR